MNPSASHRACNRGFTLIEVMAVLLLIMLIYGMALPAFGPGSGADAENDALEIAAAIESARLSALTYRENHRVVIDLRQASWWQERESRTQREPADANTGDTQPLELPEWRDDAKLPLVAPTTTTHGFQPILGLVGQGNVLRETVHFVGAETSEGRWIEDGTIAIELRPDGLADRTVLVLEGTNKQRFRLAIEPLDATVSIRAVDTP